MFRGGCSDVYWSFSVLGDKYEFGVYDPHAFMKKHNDMIFVAMNYRLGVLGFLSNDAIENEQFSGSLGNQGQATKNPFPFLSFGPVILFVFLGTPPLSEDL